MARRRASRTQVKGGIFTRIRIVHVGSGDTLVLMYYCSKAAYEYRMITVLISIVSQIFYLLCKLGSL